MANPKGHCRAPNKLANPALKAREMALEGVDVIKFNQWYEMV